MKKEKPFHRFPRVMVVLVTVCAIAGAVLFEKSRTLGFFFGAYVGWWFLYPTVELIFTDFDTLD